MTHYYYFFKAGREITADSLFCKVAIGGSAQARRDYLFLLSYSVDESCYFEIVSDVSDTFLSRVRQSLRLNVLPMRLVSSRDLVRFLKQGVALPDVASSVIHTMHHQQSQLDLNYFIASQIFKSRV